jgi:hypothetical protein
MGAMTFTPPRKGGDPEVEELAATFAHGNGMKVLHETIQYLAERSTDEQTWLTALASAAFPVTVIWGLYDTISPPRVASYVWNEYLMLRRGSNRLYFVPDANHYLQADRPDAFVKRSSTPSSPLTIRDWAPSARNRVPPCWSTAPGNGCPPQQTCSAQLPR